MKLVYWKCLRHSDAQRLVPSFDFSPSILALTLRPCHCDEKNLKSVFRSPSSVLTRLNSLSSTSTCFGSRSPTIDDVDWIFRSLSTFWANGLDAHHLGCFGISETWCSTFFDYFHLTSFLSTSMIVRVQLPKIFYRIFCMILSLVIVVQLVEQ